MEMCDNEHETKGNQTQNDNTYETQNINLFPKVNWMKF